MLRIMKVQGNSMFPSLKAGDFVLVVRRSAKHLKTGDLVVAEHRQFGRIIKRVKEKLPSEEFILSGDNQAESTASETLGTFAAQQLVGKVIYHLPKPA